MPGRNIVAIRSSSGSASSRIITAEHAIAISRRPRARRGGEHLRDDSGISASWRRRSFASASRRASAPARPSDRSRCRAPRSRAATRRGGSHRLARRGRWTRGDRWMQSSGLSWDQGRRGSERDAEPARIDRAESLATRARRDLIADTRHRGARRSPRPSTLDLVEDDRLALVVRELGEREAARLARRGSPPRSAHRPRGRRSAATAGARTRAGTGCDAAR